MEEEVYPTFPLLRPAIDQAGEAYWAERDPAWRSFLQLRQNIFAGGIHPLSSNIDKVNFVGRSVLWFKDFQKSCGVHDEIVRLGNGKLLANYEDHFRLISAHWQNGWHNLLERFVPMKYKPFFNDCEGLVSVVNDSFTKLFGTMPDPADSQFWKIRRFWSRRDWYLAHLGIILDIYSNSFYFYGIAIELDKILRLDSENFMKNDFSKEYHLPARVLRWKGKEIFLHCDWHSKSLPSLMAKVLIKQYDGHNSLYDEIYDILRGRLVVRAKDIPFVCDFIENFTDLKRVEDKENPFSSDSWKVIRYKGYFYKDNPLSKFEFQIQEVDDYLLAEYGDNSANHLSYKGRQFLTLLAIMQPPNLLEKSFGLNTKAFRQDYDAWIEKLVALDSLAYD